MEADRHTSCLYIFTLKTFPEAERPLFELVHDDALVGRNIYKTRETQRVHDHSHVFNVLGQSWIV